MKRREFTLVEMLVVALCVLALAVTIGAVTTAATAENTAAAVLRAHRFELVDDRGDVRAVAGFVDGRWLQFEFYDAGGNVISEYHELTQTTAVEPEPQAQQRQGKWVDIGSMRGSGPRTTDAFAVSDRWKIVWRTERQSRTVSGAFTLTIHDEMDKPYPAVQTSGDDSGEYEVNWSGMYYLAITSTQPYVVTVYDYQ